MQIPSGDKSQMCTTGYAGWLHRDSRRWGSAKNHPWREQQKLLGSSPKLWPGPPPGISFGEKRLSFFSTAVRGWDGSQPAPSVCREQKVLAAGGVSPAVVPPGKVTAQQVLSEQRSIQHICWEPSGEWEGAWLLLEGHFSQQKLVLARQQIQTESVGCCLGHVSR